MSFLEQLKGKLRTAREPDSLDIVEQLMEEEGQRAENDLERGSPGWLRPANVVLALILVLFLLIA